MIINGRGNKLDRYSASMIIIIIIVTSSPIAQKLKQITKIDYHAEDLKAIDVISNL